MRDSEHYRKLERAYASARINEYYAPRLYIEDGRAVIEIDVREDFFHAANAVHGSVYFKALDDAAFFAANSLEPKFFVLTQSFHMHLLRPLSAGSLVAKGRVIDTSGRLFVAEAELLDDRGRLLARGSGTFVRSKIALTPAVGYR